MLGRLRSALGSIYRSLRGDAQREIDLPGDIPQGDTSQGDTSQGDTSQGDTSQGDTSQGDTSQGEDLQEKVERVIARSAALALSTAKCIAADLLGDAEKFACHNTAPSDGEAGFLQQLGPELRALFSRYGRIVAVDADFRLSRAAIAPAPGFGGMLVLGEDAEDSQILVYPHDDRIFIVPAGEQDVEEAEQYPSIHHYIALLGALVYDEELPPLPEPGVPADGPASERA